MNPQELETMQMLVNGGNTGYLTAEQGASLAEKEYILVNANETLPENPSAYFCQVTDLGMQALGEAQTPSAFTPPIVPEPTPPPVSEPPVAAVGSKFEIAAGVAIPKIKRGRGASVRKKASLYPFDDLEENQSFHVPCTDDDPEPWKKMASNVGAANRRSEQFVEPTELITVQKRRMVRNEDGTPALDEEGKRIYEHYEQQEQKRMQMKKFIARRVDATDPNGPGCRIFRVPLNFAG